MHAIMVRRWQWARGLAALAVAATGLEVPAQPRLDVSLMPGASIRLTWDDASGGFGLERSFGVGAGAAWEFEMRMPVLEGSRWVVEVPLAAQTQFFRLHARDIAGPLTTVVETSPAGGETSVSVTRETVFELSKPLAEGTVLGSQRVVAETLGRTLLARAELSGDRRRVTLYYLERLPPGARIWVRFDGDGLMDESGRPVDVDGDGFPGGQLWLRFETANSAPLASTALIGRVLASEAGPGGTDVPLAGVTITVDGHEEALRTVTDAEGRFRLESSPVGRFFVSIDGRTATASDWPDGAYYPLLGKAWEAVAGRVDNPAGGTGIIHLPKVAAGTLRPVSAVEETRVTFPPAVLAEWPGLEGVEIVVPPNGLFSDDGTRGGRVGLAPVASDRLPEPLPAGLTHALDISIQTTGGQNFDRPVPARFPNLPDPVTGERLPPGAATALWSFNHDTGRWEMQGPMTVTADGLYAETDPGVGIRQPGWHGSSPGSSGGGGPGGPPPCSPPGILAPGTSECRDDDGCPDDPSEAKLSQQECLSKAAECAMKCYQKCGSRGPMAVDKTGS